MHDKEEDDVIVSLLQANNSSMQQRVKYSAAAFLEMLNQHKKVISEQITEKDVDATRIVWEGRREI